MWQWWGRRFQRDDHGRERSGGHHDDACDHDERHAGARGQAGPKGAVLGGIFFFFFFFFFFFLLVVRRRGWWRGELPRTAWG